MASAAWRALAQPRSIEDVVTLFQTAFPETPKHKIARDIVRLLASLEERGLLVRADSSRRKPKRAAGS